MLDIRTAEFLDAVSDALAVPPGPHPVADFLLVRGLRRRTDAVRQALALVQRDGDVEEALELLDRALSEPSMPERVSGCDLIDPGPRPVEAPRQGGDPGLGRGPGQG
ncbi:hypothetical protein [Nocardiopsis xinjiangensis]|uniref:hypothetical protein n=1 Tax=Nocardiopsis xinjiangensis TaxID=124285 RepID=UPI00034B6427|nr:hypothetical protein [Nocardiopsis xinjiangensis]